MIRICLRSYKGVWTWTWGIHVWKVSERVRWNCLWRLELLINLVFIEMIKRDTPGYAIGGLSGGEEKDIFWRMWVNKCLLLFVFIRVFPLTTRWRYSRIPFIIRVTQCTDVLPKDKPRYCMGVGYAEDLVVCCALGVDMYDCVYPTRTAVSVNLNLFSWFHPHQIASTYIPPINTLAISIFVLAFW